MTQLQAADTSAANVFAGRVDGLSQVDHRLCPLKIKGKCCVFAAASGLVWMQPNAKAGSAESSGKLWYHSSLTVHHCRESEVINTREHSTPRCNTHTHTTSTTPCLGVDPVIPASNPLPWHLPCTLRLCHGNDSLGKLKRWSRAQTLHERFIRWVQQMHVHRLAQGPLTDIPPAWWCDSSWDVESEAADCGTWQIFTLTCDL